MAQVDFSKYETVKERKERFYFKNPDGRIIVEIQNEDILENAFFKATVFMNSEDQKNNLPRSTGYAFEIRDKELKKSRNGLYESVNYTSWIENCEESAVGRALDNAGFASNMASREEMLKAKRMANTITNQTPQSTQQETKTYPITVNQRKRLWTITQSSNWTEADLRQYLLNTYKLESTNDITSQNYDIICTFIEKNPKRKAAPMPKVVKDEAPQSNPARA